MCDTGKLMEIATATRKTQIALGAIWDCWARIGVLSCVLLMSWGDVSLASCGAYYAVETRPSGVHLREWNVNGDAVSIVSLPIVGTAVTGLALDEEREVVYWTEASNGLLRSYDLRTKQAHVYVSRALGIGPLAVDTKRGIIFYAINHRTSVMTPGTTRSLGAEHATIHSLTLSSMKTTDLCIPGLTSVFRIELDAINERLYYLDRKSGVLASTNVVGTNRRPPVINPGVGCTDFALDRRGGFLYWIQKQEILRKSIGQGDTECIAELEGLSPMSQIRCVPGTSPWIVWTEGLRQFWGVRCDGKSDVEYLGLADRVVLRIATGEPASVSVSDGGACRATVFLGIVGLAYGISYWAARSLRRRWRMRRLFSVRNRISSVIAVAGFVMWMITALPIAGDRSRAYLGSEKSSLQWFQGVCLWTWSDTRAEWPTGVGIVSEVHSSLSMRSLLMPGIEGWVTNAKPGNAVRTVTIPIWIVLVTFAIGPCLRIGLLWMRERRHACPGCGYRLTGLTSPRCPECNAETIVR